MPGAPGTATRRRSPGADGGKLAASLSTLHRWRCIDGKSTPFAAETRGPCERPVNAGSRPAA